MSADVTVVDYGTGNLFGVRRALEECGGQVSISDAPQKILSSLRVVLPGVGAFQEGMQGLRELGLVDVLREYASSGRPLLGICLGMQLLASESEEFGIHQGLDIIPGRVVPIPRHGVDGQAHKIPHTGWAELELPHTLAHWRGSILDGVSPGEAVYMVHSYMVVPDDEGHRLADCRYGGLVIPAALRAGNVYGCQFHPEKSAGVGMRVLSAFMRLRV